MAKVRNDAVRWEIHSHASKRAADFPELMMLGYDRFQEASPLSDHQHDGCYEFVYVDNGRVTWEVDGEYYPSITGQVFHTRPGEWHRARLNFIEPCSIWWFILRDPADYPDWLSLRDEDRLQIHQALLELPRIVSVDSRVREQFFKLRSLLMEDNSAVFRVRHHLVDILLELLYPPAVSRQLPLDLKESMLALTAQIDASPERRWSNKELAALAGVSESHFYRLFHNMHGQSPANYMDRIRINRACELLRQPGANVTTVALDLGYKTSQHFATVFKKYIGVSPSSWRSSS
ncbi:AraC family transcriptional regulator [Paenibacillus sp. CF384]|uniref:helix-turn-helix transcriptional regulator n=1 Tax=Paenibacillus sp. CF384 TaxID=1884382 RepID=UPI000895A5A5|nr:AraC family transcriptional regulator [Paenibacillus sp. CF384]SDX14379.1 transcriptional regulator, AraC family [Paenibacillus sp. CF384]